MFYDSMEAAVRIEAQEHAVLSWIRHSVVEHEPLKNAAAAINSAVVGVHSGDPKFLVRRSLKLVGQQSGDFTNLCPILCTVSSLINLRKYESSPVLQFKVAKPCFAPA